MIHSVNEFEGENSWARSSFDRAFGQKVLVYLQKGGKYNRYMRVVNGVVADDYFADNRTNQIITAKEMGVRNFERACVWGLGLTKKGYKIVTRMSIQDWEKMEGVK